MIKEFMEVEVPRRLAAKPELATSINAMVRFNVEGDGGGSWLLDTTYSPGTVTTLKDPMAKMTITCSVRDAENIIAKKLSAQTAAMTGKLKLKPLDMGLAMKLAKLFLTH